MAYSRSVPLTRWIGPRAEVISTVAEAHAQIGRLKGPGRPLDVSKPLAHAYVVAVVAEFQAFVRDLHDLLAERLVDGTGVPAAHFPLMVEGLTAGRRVDHGNADLGAIKADFHRLGITPLDLARHDRYWTRGDSTQLASVFRLRNAVAHGNDREIARLRSLGIRDTLTWMRRRKPVLNRVASAVDHLVWDHVRATLGTDPWRRQR